VVSTQSTTRYQGGIFFFFFFFCIRENFISLKQNNTNNIPQNYPFKSGPM
jgi:hypothetical protein